MNNSKLSRRQMLKLLGAGAAGASLGLVNGATTFTPPVARAQTQATLHWMSWGGSKGIQKMADAIKTSLPDLASKYATQVVDGGPGDQEVAAALRLALASGQNIPEIVQLNRTQVAEFASAGELLPLDDIYSSVKD